MKNEHRNAPRVKESCYVAVKVIKEGQILDDQVFSLLVDLSESGCCLRSGVQLGKGTCLETAIGFSEEITVLTGVVRRSHQFGDGQWELGVEFTDVSPSVLAVLQRIISACKET